jgi:hypothetical protein
VVRMTAGGKPEISSYLATREQLEAKKQAKLAAIQLRKEGAALRKEGAALRKEDESSDLLANVCERADSVWLWDEEGAGEQGGELCCVAPGSNPGFHQIYAYQCGFDYMKSLWSHTLSGGYGSSMLDCDGDFSGGSVLHILDCHPYTDNVWFWAP